MTEQYKLTNEVSHTLQIRSSPHFKSNKIFQVGSTVIEGFGKFKSATDNCYYYGNVKNCKRHGEWNGYNCGDEHIEILNFKDGIPDGIQYFRLTYSFLVFKNGIIVDEPSYKDKYAHDIISEEIKNEIKLE